MRHCRPRRCVGLVYESCCWTSRLVRTLKHSRTGYSTLATAIIVFSYPDISATLEANGWHYLTDQRAALLRLEHRSRSALSERSSKDTFRNSHHHHTMASPHHSPPACRCGNPVSATSTSCSSCLQRQSRAHRTSPTRKPRDLSASAALHRAFAATADDDEDDQPVLFPANFYRTPSVRSSSRTSSTSTSTSTPTSPRLPPTSMAREARTSLDSLDRRTASSSAPGGGTLATLPSGPHKRAATPEPSPRPDARSARDYSPLSTAFARLKVREASPHRIPAGGGARGLQLEARMFAGPA